MPINRRELSGASGISLSALRKVNCVIFAPPEFASGGAGLKKA
ncbi:hypothetical protein CSC12_5901 [Klebsiella michiganensis]|nr:hypothetical protein A225_2232 [Klebsiella michiganensis E718]AWF55191.1 hypothetical protein CSC12_5901 [Klebsiella michiganensis]